MAEETGTIENLKDAIIDEEKKLGEEVPGAPFVVVGLTYLVILAFVLVLVAAFLWLR